MEIVSKSAVMVFTRNLVTGEWKWGKHVLYKVSNYTYLGIMSEVEYYTYIICYMHVVMKYVGNVCGILVVFAWATINSCK